jgi:hypothetical protein
VAIILFDVLMNRRNLYRSDLIKKNFFNIITSNNLLKE